MTTKTDNQLTNATDYDTSNLIFAKPYSGSIQGNGPSISYKRINIQTHNVDGSVGDLILKTPRCFSFGVSENTSQETGVVNGWSLPICLHTQGGATEEETEWVKTFENIVEACKDYIMENKEEMDQFDLVRQQLNKIASCLYVKKEKFKDPATGKTKERPVDGASPTLYAKLIYSKKNEKFVTKFYDEDDNPLDPLDLLGKYGYADCAIKIESIFVGSKISLQVKMYECNYELASSGMKRLLARPKANTQVLKREPQNSSVPLKQDDEEVDEDGSIGSDIEDEPKPTVKRKIVRRKKVTQ